MNRIDRLNAILIHLQSKKVVTAKEIAERFDISIRTVYRDIRALEEAGVPIGSEAGIGYFLADNYNLPPVMFTNEEATALLIGSKFTEQMSDDNTRRSFESAMYKIKAVLRGSEKDYLEKLSDHISVFSYSDSDTFKRMSYLSEIRKAIVTEKLIEIKYHAQYSDEITNRKVVPIGLTHYGVQWHLIAFCMKRDDYRDFRIDRIKSLKISEGSFDKDRYLNLEEYAEKIRSTMELHDISLLIRKESLRFIKDTRHWYGFTKQEEHNDTHMRLHFKNSDLKGFSRWVILAGKNIKVEQPKELADMVRSFAEELKMHLLGK
jgi:predicted DNA-binding transcriptional regulator YafY